MHLNHLDLCVPDVPAAAAFFTRHFGFRELAMRGRGRLAVLEDAGGFVLVLSNLEQADAFRYPEQFHVGFVLDDEAAVTAAYDDVRAGGAAIVHPLNRNRRGLMFYCACPGGIMVEVSARPPRDRA